MTVLQGGIAGTLFLGNQGYLGKNIHIVADISATTMAFSVKVHGNREFDP
jgi:hypothetical protein